jgi:hypothetical protein
MRILYSNENYGRKEIMTTFEDKYKAFASYLRDKQKDYAPAEMLESLSDDEIVESYRSIPFSQDYYYTKEQEREIIMEYESNENIFEAIENLKHTNHMDEQEKKLIEKFSSNIREIIVPVTEKTTNILHKLDAYGIKIDYNDLTELVKEISTIFPECVLESREFFVEESQPHTLLMGSDQCCPTCLLEKYLDRYSTLMGWSRFVLNGGINEDEITPKNYSEEIEDQLRDKFFDLLFEKCTDPEVLNKDKVMDITGKLYHVLCDSIFSLPLMTCWVYGKNIAQARIDENEEVSEFLDHTHEQFCAKYRNCPDKNQFFKDVENFLNFLSIEQLQNIYEYGFPIDLSKKDYKKINRLLELKLKNRSSTALSDPEASR